MRKLMSWRWEVAGLLNRLPSTCWAHVVSWVLDGKREQVRPMFDAESCKTEGREESCWCAKFCTPEFRAQAGIKR